MVRKLLFPRTRVRVIKTLPLISTARQLNRRYNLRQDRPSPEQLAYATTEIRSILRSIIPVDQYQAAEAGLAGTKTAPITRAARNIRFMEQP